MAQSVRSFTEVLLSVENISLAFGGVKALTDISFDIKKGEIRAIIGPNGAGKSSMLNCINGFYHPQQGTITYKGARRSQMRPHEAADPRCQGSGPRGLCAQRRLFLRCDPARRLAVPAVRYRGQLDRLCVREDQ